MIPTHPAIPIPRGKVQACVRQVMGKFDACYNDLYPSGTRRFNFKRWRWRGGFDPALQDELHRVLTQEIPGATRIGIRMAPSYIHIWFDPIEKKPYLR